MTQDASRLHKGILKTYFEKEMQCMPAQLHRKLLCSSEARPTQEDRDGTALHIHL